MQLDQLNTVMSIILTGLGIITVLGGFIVKLWSDVRNLKDRMVAMESKAASNDSTINEIKTILASMDKSLALLAQKIESLEGGKE